MTIRVGPARFSPAELVALVAGLVVMGYLAWDEALWDPRFQAPLHIAAAGAVLALALLAWRGAAVPRTTLEVPIGVLLVVLGIAALGSENLGLSARSLAISVTWALLLPVAILVMTRRPVVAVVAVTIPVVALALASLAPMIGRRIAWVAAGGPGLPPIRLDNETTPFGSVAIAPFVLAACGALTLLVPGRRLRLALQVAIVAVGLPLTLLSGSRSAWLAGGATAVAFAAPSVRRLHLRMRLPRTPLEVGAWIVAAAALLGLALYVAPRLTAVGSLLYRENLWRDTLRAWSADPMLGIGPGVMPYARQAAAAAGSFPVSQPHSHDLALGVLGDAGIVGLVAALALLAAFVWAAGPHRSATAAGRVASSLVIGYAVAGLFEDLTFLPGFDILLLLLVAVALADAGAVRWAPLRSPSGRTRRTALALPLGGVVLAAGALGLGVPAVSADTAGIVYRLASDDAWAGRWQRAEAGYAAAVAIDPWHPAGPKALTVAADFAGDRALALSSARRAVDLNPGDGASWANLAILCRSSGDTGCAMGAATKAVAYAVTGGRTAINAALVYETLGQHLLADAAYRRSMLLTIHTTLTMGWPRRVEPGDTLPPELNRTTGELDLLVARRMAGDSIDPAAFTVPAVRALAYAVLGDRPAAAAALVQAEHTSPTDSMTWDMALLLQRHWGEDASRAEAVGSALRGGALSPLPPPPRQLVWDIASFRPYPGDGLVSEAERLRPNLPWPQQLELLLPPAG